jgi:hypothetical protein
VIRTHGPTGYAIWWAILEELCATDDQGFQVEANELWLEGLAESLCLTDYRTLTRVLDTFAEIGLISAQLWAEHSIYVEAIAERGDEYVKKKAAKAAQKAKERERARQEAEGKMSQNVAGDTPATPQRQEATTPNVASHRHMHKQSSEPDPETHSDPDPERVSADADLSNFEISANSQQKRPKASASNKGHHFGKSKDLR